MCYIIHIIIDIFSTGHWHTKRVSKGFTRFPYGKYSNSTTIPFLNFQKTIIIIRRP